MFWTYSCALMDRRKNRQEIYNALSTLRWAEGGIKLMSVSAFYINPTSLSPLYV